MKYYTRIEKYKDRSKSVDANLCYEIESPKKNHWGIFVILLLIGIAIVGACIFFA